MEHLGHGGPEDVAVKQSHFIAQTGQCDGEIGRNGGFADSTLAGADGNDVLDARQHLAHLGPWLRLELRLYLHLDVLAAVVLDGSLGSLDC